jgi:hypothetical protein
VKWRRSKAINLALQGGGAHGAFTWGVLDRLLEHDGITIKSVSATSSGAMGDVGLWAGRRGDRKARGRCWPSSGNGWRARCPWRARTQHQAASGNHSILGAPSRQRPCAWLSERAGQRQYPSADHGDAPPPSAPARMNWARLLKRVFDIDMEHLLPVRRHLEDHRRHRRASPRDRQDPHPSRLAGPGTAPIPGADLHRLGPGVR